MQKQDSFTPSRDVQSAARRGLELRRRYNRGGLDNRQASEEGIGSGVQRASDLANGDSVSLATVRRMRAFFERHEQNNRPNEREGDGGPTAGSIAWLLWGGNPGRAWANRIIEQQENNAEKSIDVTVSKVDSELGIVFGYAIVCCENGEPYFDTQGDHIPEQSMLEATADFMSGERVAKNMHRGEQIGQVVYGFPITAEIAKSLGMNAERTGFVVGMKPEDDNMLEKYRNGQYTGFSIGGRRIEEDVIDA